MLTFILNALINHIIFKSISICIIMVLFKVRCDRCKKNYVTTSNRGLRGGRTIICYDCEKKDMVGEIKEPAMKKMFNIPESYYMQNSFLRKIKINYLRYGSLTQPQIDAFKKTVAEFKTRKSKEE
jgi:hypothetical protein